MTPHPRDTTRPAPLPVKASEPEEAIGHVIEDRYKLMAIIGRGGFGTVYRAEHQRLPRDFAVKILHAARAVDERQVKRFEQEVRAAAKVRHPYVVEVVDFGHDPAVGHFIVMPLLEGMSLLERLGRETVLPIVDTDTVLTQSAAALAAAHALGIVHCDIKSENVHLVNDAAAPGGFHVCILDFGVARARPLPGEEASPVDATRVVGTALSMSPEQVLRQDIDARADVYGLGVVLYEMLTGTLPFVAEKSVELMRMHVQDTPPRPSTRRAGHWIPRVLDDLVMSMLAKSREARPQSMAEVIELWEAIRAEVYDAWAGAHLTDAKASAAKPIARATELTLRLTPHESLVWADEPVALRPPPGQGAAGGTPHQGDAQKPRNTNAQTGRVLVIDDDESIRSLLRLILQNAGWNCATVSSGQAALTWLREHQAPAAVVLDMLMPGMDGMLALRAMRAQGFGGPVVFCTSVQSDAVRSQVAMQGAERFITKGRELHTIPKVLEELGLRP
jgi:CheY-like chemotaxis protein